MLDYHKWLGDSKRESKIEHNIDIQDPEREAKLLIRNAFINSRDFHSSAEFSIRTDKESEIDLSQNVHEAYREALKDKEFKEAVREEIDRIAETLDSDYPERELNSLAEVSDCVNEITSPLYLRYRVSSLKKDKEEIFVDSLEKILGLARNDFEVKKTISDIDYSDLKSVKIELNGNKINFKTPVTDLKHRKTLKNMNQLLEQKESEKMYLVSSSDGNLYREIYFMTPSEAQTFIEGFGYPDSLFAPYLDITIGE